MWYSSGNVFVFGGGTQLTVTGQPTVAPTVNAYISFDESLNKATLLCLINDFYPPDFTLKWKGDNEEITSGVETTKPTKQGDKYVASGYLTLSGPDYQNRDEYTCEVTHGGKSFAKTSVTSPCLNPLKSIPLHFSS
uniref:Ig-like domain-containing protein n=1 Tax=Ailuropoda melanoleuca TaxID=9646 RepID=A0A7N5K9A1_AILME